MKIRSAAAAMLILAALASGARSHRVFNSHERASFMQPDFIEFVRPGLQFSVQTAAAAADGTITVNYNVTDGAGLPLDAAGVNTPGPISVSYVAAFIPASQDQYVAYTTRPATGAALGTISQAGADSGGITTQTGQGQYQYTFHTHAPAGFDAGATHTIGIYGSRNLAAFNLPTNYASTTYNFVPNGAAVTKTRDVVATASCDGCHDQLSAHGGSRRGVALCVMCHTPQTIDPNTGNTVDFKVFVHKIHMGSQLPSVVAGKPYQVISPFGTADYSTVVYPADPRRCITCHNLKSGAAQASAWLTKPSRAACGACHDDVNFATGANHAGGIQTDDTRCATCHAPQGTIDFDASITGAHVVPADSSLLSGLSVAITGVTNTLAGQKPVVAFTAKDNGGNALSPASLGSLSFTMGGPASDYGYTSFGADVATPGYVTESALKAACSGGACTYTFTHAVPADAKGTYAIGVEARRSEAILAGTPKAQTVQYGAPNQVSYFAVDGSAVTSRRVVVQTANCNRCHYQLSLHGSLRNNTEYCVMCHNPSNTDVSQRPAATLASERTRPPQGINFNLLVHRIHTGDNLAALGRDYTVIGFGGSINDFSDVRFPAMSPTGSPGDTRNCSLCHTGGSETNLPLGKNAVVDPQGPINPAPAITSACTGCHAGLPSASHALSNANALGESCTVCHSTGAAFAVGMVHAQY
jgi:OmcA/MtrC family decaheme c-type cytochrome